MFLNADLLSPPGSFLHFITIAFPDKLATRTSLFGNGRVVYSDVNRKPKIWYRYQENTDTKSVFGISVPNFLVFSWYFIGILRMPLLKFG